MSAEKLPLSVAIITKDEERMLPGCLESVAFADDIVVVDSGSRDRTVEIARTFGCQVFEEEWKGFGPQKNGAIQKCRHEWVLLIDADERVPAETRPVIRRALAGAAGAAAYRLRMKNYLRGHWIRTAGYWPDWHIRLVDRSRGSFTGTTHEQWVTTGAVEDLDGHLDHLAFPRYSDMLRSLDEYSSILAADMFAAGRRTHPLAPPFHGLAMFLKIYLVQRGFLAGTDGLIIALTKAGGSFFKYAKLLELQRERGA